MIIFAAELVVLSVTEEARSRFHTYSGNLQTDPFRRRTPGTF